MAADTKAHAPMGETQMKRKSRMGIGQGKSIKSKVSMQSSERKSRIGLSKSFQRQSSFGNSSSKRKPVRLARGNLRGSDIMIHNEDKEAETIVSDISQSTQGYHSNASSRAPSKTTFASAPSRSKTTFAAVKRVHYQEPIKSLETDSMQSFGNDDSSAGMTTKMMQQDFSRHWGDIRDSLAETLENTSDRIRNAIQHSQDSVNATIQNTKDSLHQSATFVYSCATYPCTASTTSETEETLLPSQKEPSFCQSEEAHQEEVEQEETQPQEDTPREETPQEEEKQKETQQEVSQQQESPQQESQQEETQQEESNSVTSVVAVQEEYGYYGCMPGLLPISEPEDSEEESAEEKGDSSSQQFTGQEIMPPAGDLAPIGLDRATRKESELQHQSIEMNLDTVMANQRNSPKKGFLRRGWGKKKQLLRRTTRRQASI